MAANTDSDQAFCLALHGLGACFGCVDMLMGIKPIDQIAKRRSAVSAQAY